ncbi:hypothetical protein Tco_1155577 [Tanacetum coccineum]
MPIGLSRPSEWVKIASNSNSSVSPAQGLTADSLVLTLTLAFLDFGLDSAQSLHFHAQFERREQAAIQEAKSKKKMEKYYNSRVRGTSFKPGDMVYRSNEASHARDEGKLGPKWEGPYEVKESLGKGAYKLKDCKGNEMPRTWNICNLKKCYIHEV